MTTADTMIRCSVCGITIGPLDYMHTADGVTRCSLCAPSQPLVTTWRPTRDFELHDAPNTGVCPHCGRSPFEPPDV